MTITIITKDNTVNSCFVKANIYLTKNFQQEFELTTDKEQVLIDLWQSKFKATLEKHNGYFSKIVFQSDKDLTMFNLRFN